MKKKMLLLIFISFSFIGQSQIREKPVKLFGKLINNSKYSPTGEIRCATDEYELYLQQNNPKRMSNAQFEAWLHPLVEQYKKGNSTYSQSGGIITIPVVVHVIHNGDAYGTNENIPDEQVKSQITVLNQDFRRMAGTPGFNSNPVGTDTQIQFELAKVDPNGNPTNGINRVNLCQSSWSTNAVDSTVKPATSWDPSSYMNMWSVNFSDNTLLGFAQFPDQSGLGGLNPSGGPANTDGVVSNYASFGSRTIYPAGNYGNNYTYDKGRTMTHEVGHWIGLRHIWGDGGCSVDDYCNDTPVAGVDNYGCASGRDSCPASPGLDMYQNYMDYSDDACMNIFTADQKARMVVIMNNAARRKTLKTSIKDLPITLFANDGETQIERYCTNSPNSCTGNQHSVLLYNRGTTNLTTAAINYNINGGANTTINWSGNLLPNRYAVIKFNTIQSNGTLNVTIASLNGTTDQRASNNASSRPFSFPAITPPTDYAYTAFRYTLVGDAYADETTWSLTNAGGVILYSGGPYTQVGTYGTQNLVTNQLWNLPPGCYTYTINDSYSDGISTNYGSGYWNIKTNSGLTTVASGGNFGASQSASFTNASLNSYTFEVLDHVRVYPNPSNDILNVSISNAIELPSSYKIINTLGQLVKSDGISVQDFSLNTSQFSAGVYLLQLNFTDKIETIRFIKN